MVGEDEAKEEEEEEEEEEEVEEEEESSTLRKLAKDSNQDVAGPAAALLLERMKSDNITMYYEMLGSVVKEAEKNDDVEMVTNKLRLYEEMDRWRRK